MAVSTEILKDGGTSEGALKSFLGGDNHTNSDPVRDDNTDWDANDANNWAKLLAELAARVRKGNLCVLPFYLATTPVGATTAVPVRGSAAAAEILPFDATLVGISAWFISALTAGSATIQPKLGGGNSDLSLLISSPSQNGIERQVASDRGTNDGTDASAIDLIQCDVITPGGTTWAGSSNLYVNLVFSMGEEEDF
jgi:hypothetical protein